MTGKMPRPGSSIRSTPADAAIVVCDEDPTTSLIERHSVGRDAIGAITEQGLGEHILAGLSSPGGLLAHFRDRGITPEQVRKTASRLGKRERKRGQIVSPNASDAVLSRAAKSAASLVRVSRILERLADELASGRPGVVYSLLPDGDRLIAQGRRHWPFDPERRLLVLDGTANPKILREFVPSLGTVPEIRVQRKARVIQVSNSTFYKGRLIRRNRGLDGEWRPEPSDRLLEVVGFIEKTARLGKTLRFFADGAAKKWPLRGSLKRATACL